MPEFRSFVRRHLWHAMLFSLAINLALLAPSLFMLQVYDRVLITRSVETLVMLGALAALTLLAMGTLEQVRSRMLGLVGMALERRFGAQILAQQIVAHARSSGREYQDGMRDLAVLRGFVAGPAIVAVFDAPWALVYLTLVAAFDWRLGALALMAALVLVALTWANDRLVRRGLDELQDKSRAAGRWVERSLQNAEVVTAMGMSTAMTRHWLALTHEVHDAGLATTGRTSTLSAATRSFRQLIQVLMLSTGAWLVIREGATPGVMIATTIILGRALAPVEQLVAGWQTLAQARASFGRLRDLLARPGEGAVATALPRPQGHLSVEALTYGNVGGTRLLLRQVSFSVRAGETLAIVGGSGAGKTTLARLLVGVLRPSAGVVRLDGADIRMWDPRALGPAIGYLPQDVELFAGSVAQNIARLGEVDSAVVIEAARAAGVHEMILRLPAGYDTPVGDAGNLLSGGQRQRVGLARALFGRPALVVLDEADASLDAEGEESLMGAIARLKVAGCTVVAVTQRRRLLAVADRVLVLKDGVIERTAVRSEAGTESETARVGNA